jgi:hypothetical protein
MNTNEPKPLDHETLICIREGVEWRRGLPLDDKDIAIAELLADRDYQEKRADEAATKAALHDDAARMLCRDFAIDGDPERKHAVDAALVAARRYRKLEAEVTSLRARVRVEAEDVERLGVTRAHVVAWLCEHGWAMAPTFGWSAVARLTRPDAKRHILVTSDTSAAIAVAVNSAAYWTPRRPSLDVLDEMAAMPLEPAT